ncbi:hypothetical protein SDC9_43532 [bioreactor metagenome]|uniref:VTT domain-containing protein n=1 Tax=bioreactor metagenome TaxID=1076179 RepID=A0A644W3R2_9ZZZZ|nr:TVP38/TMEM64 family protein [Negativicutes bacterium]
MICSRKMACKAGLSVALLAVAVAGVYSMGLQRLTPEAIHKLILAIGWWGPVLYLFLFTIRPLFLFPSIIFTLAGAMAFGPIWGTVYGIVGATLGACLCFGLTRLLGREKVEKLAGDCFKLSAFNDSANEYGFRTVLLIRFIPVFHWDLVSYAAGLSKIRFSNFIAATAVGAIPGAVAYNFLGYSFNQLLSPLFYTSLLIGVVVCTPFLYHIVKKR